VCRGNKVAGEYCDNNEECISNWCINGECSIKSIIYPLWVWIIIAVITFVAITLILVAVLCGKKFLYNENMRLSKSGSFDKQFPLLGIH
jgi:hypothetical protein